MAYKTFVAGDVLTASDVNTYLMRQSVIACTSSTRPASPAEGMTIFETDTDKLRYYDGSAWVDVSSGGWTTYTPTFSAQFTLGNGTVAAQYARIGKTILYRGEIVFGSTTAYGTNATDTIQVSTPVTCDLGVSRGILGPAWYADSSAGIVYPALIGTDTSTQLSLYFFNTNTTANTVTGTTFNNNYPTAEGAGDTVGWFIVFEEA